MAQSMAILRYIGKKYRGRNGETLYPGAADPDQSMKIDQILELGGPFLETYIHFMLPFLPTYKQKDNYFIQFITKHFPALLEKLDSRLSKYGHKYLVSPQMSIADVFIAGELFKMAYNEEFEH